MSVGLLVSTACTAAVDGSSGVNEPIRVPTGVFREGDIVSAGNGPRVTTIESMNGIVHLGQRGRSLGGRVDADAWAIALRFATLGSGWWTHEIEDIDPLHPDERGFALDYDVGTGIPPGRHTVSVAAVDERGSRGPVFDLELCVIDESVPDALNACDPSLPPPAIVLGVMWDRAVDLDLIVETPDGKIVKWKSPTTAPTENGMVTDDALEDPSVGRLQRDSNAGCVADGRNSEAVVWEAPPASGLHSAYVDLFDACDELQVTFTVAVYRRQALDDGTWQLVESEHRTGMLVPTYDVSGGKTPPLYVMSTELP